MTPTPLPSVTEATPSCCYILPDGTKVRSIYCPLADVGSIHDMPEVKGVFTIVLPALGGPGLFLVQFKNINPIDPAAHLPA